MSSDAGDETRISPGFPIRTPSDHSPVIDSPRLIADSNVLHRFLVPRHPPCALKNLTTKMLASTMQFSTHQPTPTRHPRITREQQTSEATHQSKPATADPSDTQQRTTRPPHQTHHAFPTPRTPHAHSAWTKKGAVLTTAHLPQQPTIDVPPTSTHSSHHTRAASRAPQQRKLLRKEVIQPHLPVRLPCYDLVPIASPTFDGSPHKG